MEGSTRGGEVCGLSTPLLGAVRRDAGANERAESKGSRSGVRQGLESATAQCLHRFRNLSRAKAACDAVDPTDLVRTDHPLPAQIRQHRRDTGVGVSTRDDALSASLPPGAFAGRLSPEASAVRVLKGAVRRRRRGHTNSAKACAVHAPRPEAVRAGTVAVCCACHGRRPWHGSSVHCRDGGGRAAAVRSRRVGERGLHGWVVSSRRSVRSISLARTAVGAFGSEFFNLGVEESHQRVASSSFVSSKGECDEHGTPCEGKDSTSRPTTPSMTMASIRGPQASVSEEGSRHTAETGGRKEIEAPRRAKEVMRDCTEGGGGCCRQRQGRR
eukprot:6212156-Pleurochrysis_carterae.AAC.1